MLDNPTLIVEALTWIAAQGHSASHGEFNRRYHGLQMPVGSVSADFPPYITGATIHVTSAGYMLLHFARTITEQETEIKILTTKQDVIMASHAQLSQAFTEGFVCVLQDPDILLAISHGEDPKALALHHYKRLRVYEPT